MTEEITENRKKINELAESNNALIAEIKALKTTLDTVKTDLIMMKEINEAEKRGMEKAKLEMKKEKEKNDGKETTPDPTKEVGNATVTADPADETNAIATDTVKTDVPTATANPEVKV